jgi:hypothetical protein
MNGKKNEDIEFATLRINCLSFELKDGRSK